jgi:hypothetical protein
MFYYSNQLLLTKRLLIKNFVAQMLAQEKQTREQHSLSTENVGGGSTLKV